MKDGLNEKTWDEFQATGLLWWINRTLHLFGWVVVVAKEEGSNKIVRVYPARTSWRGFDRKDEEQGFKKVSAYLVANAPELKEEADQ